MARTPQWIKKLGGHAGELFVAAELSKRAIPNALLPENFSDDDILIGTKDASATGFVQVKSCHPDRSSSFILRAANEEWVEAGPNSFCILVWLGKTVSDEGPRHWIAPKAELGTLCINHPAHGTSNWERRFWPSGTGAPKYCLPDEWRNRWHLLDRFRPANNPAPDTNAA